MYVYNILFIICNPVLGTNATDSCQAYVTEPFVVILICTNS